MRIRKEWAIPAGVGIVSFGIGFVVGHILTKYRFKIEVEPEEDKDTAESEFIQLQFKMDDCTKQIIKAVKEAEFVISKPKEVETGFSIDIPIQESYSTDTPPSSTFTSETHIREEETVQSITAFYADDDGDDWDFDIEVPSRTQDKPYIIHRDEFFDQETDYGQSTLTYYDGDKVLTDEQDVPIYEADKIVGELKFGHGSRDPNICYVRNDNLEAEWEILFDPGFFGVEILGAREEDLIKKSDLKHSVPKFRME